MLLRSKNRNQASINNLGLESEPVPVSAESTGAGPSRAKTRTSPRRPQRPVTSTTNASPSTRSPGATMSISTRKRKAIPSTFSISSSSSNFSSSSESESDSDSSGCGLILRCTFCEAKCSSYKTLGQHMQSVHFNPRPQPVDAETENSLFSIFDAGTEELFQHDNDSEEKMEVDQMFQNIQLITGLETISYTCSVCNQEFSEEASCARHFEIEHVIEVKPLQCGDCNKFFQTEEILKVHSKLCLYKKKKNKTTTTIKGANSKSKSSSDSDSSDEDSGNQPAITTKSNKSGITASLSLNLETRNITKSSKQIEPDSESDSSNSDSPPRPSKTRNPEPRSNASFPLQLPKKRNNNFKARSSAYVSNTKDSRTTDLSSDSSSENDQSSSSSFKPSSCTSDSESCSEKPTSKTTSPNPCCDTESESSDENSSKSKSEIKKKKTFLCGFPGCTIRLSSKESANFHYKRVHDSGSAKFQCQNCTKVFKSQEYLNFHTKLHAESEKCPYCPLRPIGGLPNHLRISHPEKLGVKKNPKGSIKSQFKCKYCSIGFHSENNRNEHTQLAHGKHSDGKPIMDRNNPNSNFKYSISSYICSICKRDFVFFLSLRKHYLTHL